jgi:SnoaL-like protein
MPERTVREFAAGWVDVLARRDYDRLGDFLAPDCVHEYPQSGERLIGLANIRAVYENYPGGVGEDVTSLAVGGDIEPWAIAPNFTLVRVAGACSPYTATLRARYPDGSMWYVINLFELAGGKMSRAVVYFAPFFDPPEWRAPFREPRPAAEAGP